MYAVSALPQVDQKSAVAMFSKVLASGIWTEWSGPGVKRCTVSLIAQKWARGIRKPSPTSTRTIHARKLLLHLRSEDLSFSAPSLPSSF